MSDDLAVDGDVYVSPRYLAGSTFTGDPALRPLLALGWRTRHDEDGNVYLSSPDSKVRLGYLPEGEDDGLWRISAYDDVFAQPHWGVCFSDTVPTEFVTAFTTALAQAYTDGPDTYLSSSAGRRPSAFDAVAPLITRGWTLQPPREGVIKVDSADGMAGLEYAITQVDPARELTTTEARWYLWGGVGAARWYATASTHTPVPLVTAITTAVGDPAPLPRWKAAMPRALREAAQLTPVMPPPPPAPTPLDVRRTAARRPPALGTVSVPRWSTTSRPAAPPVSHTTGPRR
ncbi:MULTISPECIES: DUF317 domain-containing protein [Streptomyces]|uniref:DUF317 domain-containing protein n=1 Tax=Streptomyces TaxID=1883 RepID=UPI00163C5187|nr:MULTISPECIES: DUF317 domain-containing protein [Streptomyces]MBC2878089.1 DUF317 domain-containing protein [Streptomyces sp. TYQ1024]UBI40037.1 DUF317 domain-containing protein [Streptomyces mobaraensis]UKW32617.1 DUF317 domain-containing protein [Streptomyces sp. TYQ1024]